MSDTFLSPKHERKKAARILTRGLSLCPDRRKTLTKSLLGTFDDLVERRRVVDRDFGQRLADSQLGHWPFCNLQIIGQVQRTP